MKKTGRHIRFGIVCGSTHLHLWQEMVVMKLISETDIELKLVILEGNQQREKRTATSSSSLWNLYYRYRVQKKSTTLKLNKSDTLFEGIPKVHLDFVESGNREVQFQDDYIAKIENAKLDFIINFSPTKLIGKALNIPRHGVWVFQFGNPEKYKDVTPCFWEIYNQDVVTSGYLTRLTDESGTMDLLHQGHLKTSIFHKKNMDKMFQECTSWPLKVCEDIREGSSENLGTTTKVNIIKIVRFPSNLQILLFPLIQLKLLLKQGWKQLFFTDYWNIGIVRAPIQEFLNAEKKHIIHWFPNLPKTRFMADPFGLYFKDQLHILYEDLKFEDGIGKTASCLYDEGEFKQNNIVIDEEYHMSYPFLFEKDDEFYCIPETSQANQVRLYKALVFPTKWELKKVLIEDYAGIDSTIFKHEDTWFLFSTNKRSGHRYNLNIHHSTSIFGPWREHPKNPVKTDIRSARPAGTLFEYNGAIYRPSMDYSERIEGRIIINKILTLTVRDFKEEVHNSIDPFKDSYFSDKVHTLSQVGSYTLVDGAKELFIFNNFHAFKYKVKRIIAELKKLILFKDK